MGEFLLMTVCVLLVWAAYLVVHYDNGHGGFASEPASPVADVHCELGSRQTLSIAAADGMNIEGWLYAPRSTGAPAPLLIMAPGLTGTKEGPLETFAWQFVEAGYAVLTIDFRGFGGSGGQPRHWVDPFRHAEDYESAVYFAQTELAGDPRLDIERIALWGSSFSGATALAAASGLPQVAAVIAQCPYLGTPTEREPKGLNVLRYSFWVALDMARAALARRGWVQDRPLYVPAFGQPGEFAFAISAENPSLRDPRRPGSAFWQRIPRQLRGGWQNKLMVRFLAEFDRFKPMQAVDQIECPVFFAAGASDDMIPVAMVRDAASRARNGASEVHVFDCGHFDLYLDDIQRRNVSLQIAFLGRVFGSPRTSGRSQLLRI